SGPRPARMALPSSSFGHMTPTFLFVATCGHRCVYASKKFLTPKQKWMPYRNGDLVGSFAPRPKYHASHGTTVVMYGTCAASQASAAGFTTSGVEVASIRSTFVLLMSWPATFAACAGADWLSLFTIFTAYFLPATVNPDANALRARPSTYGSGSPKPAAGPVSGLTKPSVIVLAASAVSAPFGRAHAGPASDPPAISPAAPTPARLSKSRLLISPAAKRSDIRALPRSSRHGRTCGRYDARVSKVKTVSRLFEQGLSNMQCFPPWPTPLPIRSRSSAASPSCRPSVPAGRCSESASSAARSASAAAPPTA